MRTLRQAQAGETAIIVSEITWLEIHVSGKRRPLRDWLARSWGWDCWDCRSTGRRFKRIIR